MSKSSTRKNKRRPLPGWARSGLIKGGCSCAPHSWRQSKTVPSESRICPKSGWAGDVSGWPNSDWYQWKLPGTSRTPMIVHVRFIDPPDRSRERALRVRLELDLDCHVAHAAVGLVIAGDLRAGEMP